MFENVLVRGIAATTIAEQQDRIGVAIALLADAVPIPQQTVASELACIARQSKVDVPTVSDRIVDAVRNDHAVSPTGKVVIECLERLIAANSASTVKLAQMFFGLGVHGKVRVAQNFVFVDQRCNSLKLGIAVGMRTASQVFAYLPQSQAFIFHPLANGIVTYGSSQRVQFLREDGGREVGEDNGFVVGVARCPRVEQRVQIPLGWRVCSDLFFRPAPGRRTRPSAGSFGKSSSSAMPRSMVRVEQRNN